MEESAIQIPKLIGRNEELSRLKQALEKTIEGEGSTLFIAGEAGVGKTRLVDEFIKQAETKGVFVIKGGCMAEALMPFFPFKEMTEKIMNKEVKDKKIIKGLKNAWPNILGFIPVVGPIMAVGTSFGVAYSDQKKEAEDLKFRRERMFDSYLDIIQLWSQKNPVLMILDDLQWADPSSLALLHYLSRNTTKDKVLIVGIYRPEDVVDIRDGEPHQLEVAMQNMNREDLYKSIQLQRMDVSHTKEIIESTLGVESIDQDIVDRIYDETEGNPFFIIEVLKLLVEDEAIVQDKDGSWVGTLDIKEMNIPSKVYDVVKRRLSRLMKEQRDILECASVIGEEFQSDILCKGMDTSKFILLKNLNEIEKTHQLVHYLKDKYRFDHTKVKEVLYNGIGEELRKEYHRIVADTLAALHKDEMDGDVSEIAYHYYEAGDEKAVQYLIKAGDRAKEKYANEEAIRFYNNSLEMMVANDDKVNILEKVADIQKLIGDYDKAIDNYEKACELAQDNDVKARMKRKAGITCSYGGEYEKSLETLEQAKEFVDNKSLEYCRIICSEGNHHIMKGENEKAGQKFDEAIKIFDNRADNTEIGNVYRVMGNLSYFSSEYEQALEYYGKSLKLMEINDDKKGIASAYNGIASAYRVMGNLKKALVFYERGLEISEKLGDKRTIGIFYNNIGNMYDDWGDLEKSLEFHQASLGIKMKIGDKQGVAMALTNIGIIYHYKGDLEKALGYMEQGLEIRNQIDDTVNIGISLLNIGEIYYDKGELDKAMDFYNKSIEVAERTENKELAVHGYSYLAKTHLGNDNVEDALENAETAVAIGVEVSALFEWLGRNILGRIYRETKNYEKATEEFRKVEDILLEADELKELTILFYEQGLLFKAMGEPAKARELLEKALSEFQRMGMKLWVEKTEKALGEL